MLILYTIKSIGVAFHIVFLDTGTLGSGATGCSAVGMVYLVFGRGVERREWVGELTLQIHEIVPVEIERTQLR